MPESVELDVAFCKVRSTFSHIPLSFAGCMSQREPEAASSRENSTQPELSQAHQRELSLRALCFALASEPF